MMIKLAWGILGLIHLLPAVAFVRPSLLSSMYGIEGGSPAYLLIWHRAALFAMAVVICIWAALRPEVRPLAAVAMTISMVGFLLLYLLNGSPLSLRTIAWADLAGLPFLAFAAWDAFRSGAFRH